MTEYFTEVQCKTFCYAMVFLCETIRIHLIQGFHVIPSCNEAFLNHAGTH